MTDTVQCSKTSRAVEFCCHRLQFAMSFVMHERATIWQRLTVCSTLIRTFPICTVCEVATFHPLPFKAGQCNIYKCENETKCNTPLRAKYENAATFWFYVLISITTTTITGTSVNKTNGNTTSAQTTTTSALFQTTINTTMNTTTFIHSNVPTIQLKTPLL
jgi:hypothetical protein